MTKAQDVMNKLAEGKHPKDCTCEECKESKKEKNKEKSEGEEKVAKKLTTKAREHVSKKNFAEPGKKKYPIEDKNHARNALARVSQFGSPAEKAEVRAKVHAKYPDIK
jgi:hypothetical protein